MKRAFWHYRKPVVLYCAALFIVCLYFLLPQRTHAQSIESSQWQSLYGQWLEENEITDNEELTELLQDLLEHPVNLNDTASSRILSLPFVSPLQAEIIKAYILQHGAMASIYEMYLLNGFDSRTLQLIRPFITVAPIEEREHLKLNEVIQWGKSHLLMGTRRAFPEAIGYQDSTYLGSPYRIYFRYQFHYHDRVKFQLSGEKDPGEQFLRGAQRQGFDHYGWHLQLSDIGPLARIVVGHYNLQWGQGLTLWNGFSPWCSDVASLWRYGAGAKGAGSMTEYGYFNGIASSLQLTEHIEITPFYSIQHRDATIPKKAFDDDGNYLWIQSINTTGYHRSTNEIAKKNKVVEQMAGSRLQWSNPHLTIGLTGYEIWFDKPIRPIKYVYNYNAFRGTRGLATGIDASYLWRQFHLFGELSYARALDTTWTGIPIAGLAGAILDIDADNKIALTYRNYAPTYQNIYASALGRNSQNQNERGIKFLWDTKLPYAIEASIMADFYQFPEMKYRIYAPSTGKDLSIRIRRNIGRSNTISLYYFYRMGKRNTTEEGSSNYIQEEIINQRLQALWTKQTKGPFYLQTKAVITRFHCQMHDDLWGWALSQDISYTPSWKNTYISFVGRIALFNIDDYDCRIYLSEQSPTMESSSTMLQGKGIRTYLLTRWDISETLKGTFRWGMTYYLDRDTVGSSHDATLKQWRQELMIQLRWSIPPLHLRQ